MKTISQLLFNLILSAIALTLAFAIMLHFHTAPATAFAYLLFFTTLRFIATFSLTRERILQFAVASILCIATSFWTLRATPPLAWDRPDASPYSIAWRSALILLCLFAIPHLASRSIKPIRLPIA